MGEAGSCEEAVELCGGGTGAPRSACVQRLRVGRERHSQDRPGGFNVGSQELGAPNSGVSLSGRDQDPPSGPPLGAVP